MLQKIKELLQDANPSYQVEYEESSMMNIKVDDYPLGRKFVYIEEFVRGKFTKGKYSGRKQLMKLQIYFCQFSEMHNDAIRREQQRKQIITDVVRPFIEKYEKSKYFEEITDWGIYYPLPRFDANEVSVMLEFDCIMNIC